MYTAMKVIFFWFGVLNVALHYWVGLSDAYTPEQMREQQMKSVGLFHPMQIFYLLLPFVICLVCHVLERPKVETSEN